ncbi:MAG: hypothetical protein DMD83_26395 [Candidatus Rokuibacteriota bacterium]|nr:MAG: hypothetical protein DMD83_26395 [Candidatus Rokubacteria bacterium]
MNCTPAIPAPAEAAAETLILPETVAPALGVVIETETAGGVVVVKAKSPDTAVFVEASVDLTR